MTGTVLAKQFTRNSRYLAGQLEGIGHAASLTQPTFGANCLNWTVGHILQYRGSVASALGIEIAATGGLERYARESDPITEKGPGVVDFGVLLDGLAATEQPLASALELLTDGQLAAEIESGDRLISLAERILFLYFHDTLHCGQADVLAALSRAR